MRQTSCWTDLEVNWVGSLTKNRVTRTKIWHGETRGNQNWKKNSTNNYVRDRLREYQDRNGLEGGGLLKYLCKKVEDERKKNRDIGCVPGGHKLGME